MKFKGPAFPSYFESHAPKSRMQWKAHCGQRARMRNLRQACKAILESTDPETVRQRERVLQATKHEPHPEFGFLHLVHAAQDACDQTGEPWSVCMKYMMDKYDDIEADRAVSTPVPLDETLHA